MIPVYVINLKRSVERRAWMQGELERAGVTAEFVAAVDGRRFGARCGSDSSLSKAEAALALSHRKVWRRLLSSAAAYAAVLEDDVHLGEGFCEVLQIDWSRPAFDLVKLETLYHRAWLTRAGAPLGLRALHRLGAEHLGAAGYVVSREGAKKLLRATRRFAEPVDQSLFGRRAVFEGEIGAYQLVPAIVVQDNLHPDPRARREMPSTLHEADRKALAERTRSAKPQGIDRMRREASRFYDQMRRIVRLAPRMRCKVVPFE